MNKEKTTKIRKPTRVSVCVNVFVGWLPTHKLSFDFCTELNMIFLWGVVCFLKLSMLMILFIFVEISFAQNVVSDIEIFEPTLSGYFDKIQLLEGIELNASMIDDGIAPREIPDWNLLLTCIVDSAIPTTTFASRDTIGPPLKPLLLILSNINSVMSVLACNCNNSETIPLETIGYFSEPKYPMIYISSATCGFCGDIFKGFISKFFQSNLISIGDIRKKSKIEFIVYFKQFQWD